MNYTMENENFVPQYAPLYTLGLGGQAVLRICGWMRVANAFFPVVMDAAGKMESPQILAKVLYPMFTDAESAEAYSVKTVF